MKRLSLHTRASTIVVAIVVALAGLGYSGVASAKDMMVTAIHPNNLILIDLAARKVVRNYEIPGRGYAQTINVSPDGKVAYILTGGWGIISGINLDSGKEVFRADMSKPVELGKLQRVKVVSFVVSRDGKELFAFQSPMEILPGEFKVVETRIAVYKTTAGTEATPVRTFPAPRRISIMATSVDGKTIYGVGWDIYGFDAKTGKTEIGRKCREFILTHIFGAVAQGIGGGGIADTPFSQLPKEEQAKNLAGQKPPEAPQGPPDLRLRPKPTDGPPEATDAPEQPASEERVG